MEFLFFCVWLGWGGGGYYKGSQYVQASPVAGTELSLFISFVLFTVAQWD